MKITGAQCRAARALIEWPRHQVAQLSGVEAAIIADFEAGRGNPDEDVVDRLRRVLEEGGAVFISDNGGGVGVRLKFSRKDVRAINKWENEGGPIGTDDV
ncbi:MAG: multiprotein-bridging factor 1 family protein [Sphingomonadaceae bacterium]